MGAIVVHWTPDEFETYRQKIAEILERCGCDLPWPNEVCRTCAGTTERFMAVEREYLKYQTTRSPEVAGGNAGADAGGDGGGG